MYVVNVVYNIKLCYQTLAKPPFCTRSLIFFYSRVQNSNIFDFRELGRILNEF